MVAPGAAVADKVNVVDPVVHAVAPVVVISDGGIHCVETCTGKEVHMLVSPPPQFDLTQM
jgi:hypothetical protein